MSGSGSGSESTDATSRAKDHAPQAGEGPEARRNRVRARMQECKVDLVILPPGADVRYLLGSTVLPDERPAYFLLGQEKMAFVVPALNAEELAERTRGQDLPLMRWHDLDGPTGALRDALKHLGVAGAKGPIRIAMGDPMRLDHALALDRALQAADLPGLPPFALSTDVVAPVRMRKDPAELRALQESSDRADDAMEAAFAALRAGVRELDISQAIVNAFGQGGADRTEFSLVAAGRNAAEPHHRADATVIQSGDPVFLDIGCTFGGYQSDLTRMAHVGAPSAEYLQVHDTVRRACDAGLATARPGASAADVDRAARAVIVDAGYGEFFVHRTGHGIGLEGHEPPAIQTGNEMLLDVGMAFSIEPGIYLPGRFGVRIEDVVVIGEDGGRRLSRLPHAVHVVAP